MSSKIKKGSAVIVTPIDGPLPAGIPYTGYKTTVAKVISEGESYSVHGTNGKETFVFHDEIEVYDND